MRAARRDEGQVLILAGFVLVMAFMFAAFAAAELAGQETALRNVGARDLTALFREDRDAFAQAMSALVIPSTDNASLLQSFDSQRLEFEERARGHGVFEVVSLANGTDAYANQSERLNLTVSDGAASPCPGGVNRRYTAWSYNGSRDFSAKSWDCGDDGILWDRDAAMVKGVAIHLFMSHETARLEETVVVAVN